MDPKIQKLMVEALSYMRYVQGYAPTIHSIALGEYNTAIDIQNYLSTQTGGTTNG